MQSSEDPFKRLDEMNQTIARLWNELSAALAGREELVRELLSGAGARAPATRVFAGRAVGQADALGATHADRVRAFAERLRSLSGPFTLMDVRPIVSLSDRRISSYLREAVSAGLLRRVDQRRYAIAKKLATT